MCGERFSEFDKDGARLFSFAFLSVDGKRPAGVIVRSRWPSSVISNFRRYMPGRMVAQTRNTRCANR